MKAFDLQKEKKLLVANLNHLKSLDVEEYTFLKKWEELNDWLPTHRDAIHLAQLGIWEPSDITNRDLTIQAIEAMRPEIVFVDDDRLKQLWEIYRVMVSSGADNGTVGRNIKFFVVDKNLRRNLSNQSLIELQIVKKECPPLPWPVLGVGCVSSDFGTIQCRDSHIGWDAETRMKGKKINHTANGSTIVPTQPFGFNFLGGKLIASMITSEAIRTEWQLRYGDILAGLTTTSLYGGKSMYDGLPRWQNLGVTKGAVAIEPNVDIYSRWKEYLRSRRKKEYDEATKQEGGIKNNAKGHVLNLAFTVAGIEDKSQYRHGFERGVYFSEFYENTKEFLCGRCSEGDLERKRNGLCTVVGSVYNDTPGISQWWKEQAIGRYSMLHKQGRLKSGKHFYSALTRLDYKAAKEMFLEDVGR